MNSEALEERLLEFSARVGRVVDALPDTVWAGILPGSLFAVERLPLPTMQRPAVQRVARILFTNSVSLSRNFASREAGYA